MLLDLLFIVLGLVGLFYGADWLVKGAARLAGRFGIPPLVIGLTVVSYGTSMPEQVVSLTAIFRGNDAVSVGNVVGSNIFNIALILGLTALITPIQINARLIRREIPLMIAASVLATLFMLSGSLSRVEGGVLFAGVLLFSYFTYRSQTGQGDPALAAEAEEYDEAAELLVPDAKPLLETGRLLLGLLTLIIGAQLTIDGSISVATAIGISQTVIGLTLVAMGTSLPELATSLVAAFRREDDISVGNIVGSNIFNLLSILGLTALIHPLQVPEDIQRYDLPIMIGIAVLLLPLSLRLTLGKFHGLLLLAIYVAYTLFLALR